ISSESPCFGNRKDITRITTSLQEVAGPLSAGCFYIHSGQVEVLVRLFQRYGYSCYREAHVSLPNRVSQIIHGVIVALMDPPSPMAFTRPTDSRRPAQRAIRCRVCVMGDAVFSS